MFDWEADTDLLSRLATALETARADAFEEAAGIAEQMRFAIDAEYSVAGFLRPGDALARAIRAHARKRLS